MPCHVRRASVSSRRNQRIFEASRPSPASPQQPLPLAVLDLDKASERDAHDLLLRAGSQLDPMWTLLDMRRQASSLLCVVRWSYPSNTAKPFSLAEVSLTEKAVFWRYYPTADAARAEMDRRCAETAQQSIASR